MKNAFAMDNLVSSESHNNETTNEILWILIDLHHFVFRFQYSDRWIWIAITINECPFQSSIILQRQICIIHLWKRNKSPKLNLNRYEVKLSTGREKRSVEVTKPQNRLECTLMQNITWKTLTVGCAYSVNAILQPNIRISFGRSEQKRKISTANRRPSTKED